MDKLDELRGYLRQLIAVETLEYEDKDWLSKDNYLRSENKEELLNICRLIVDELKEERDLPAASLRKEIVHDAECRVPRQCACGLR